MGQTAGVLRHIVVFSWKPDTTPEQVASVENALTELQALVPELRSYAFGSDLGLSAVPGDFAVVAEFEDEAGWRVYDQHPFHATVRSEVIGPLAASRMGVQFSS